MLRGEVGGRIVEREVAVLADADECDVDGALGDRASRPLGDRRGVSFAVEQVVPRETRLADQPLEQVLAEAGRVLDRQADVLVEVKHLDARPVDAGRGGEGVEKVELRGAGRGDDPGFFPCLDRRTQGLRGVPRRRHAQGRPIDVCFDLHDPGQS